MKGENRSGNDIPESLSRDALQCLLAAQKDNLVFKEMITK